MRQFNLQRSLRTTQMHNVLLVLQGRDRYYLAFDSTAGANYQNGFVYSLLVFLTFWILLSYLIPNSLFVTIEIIKFVLGFVFINGDKAMQEEGGESAQCRNANLNEDLGKIDYIFSDKTGTLTSNEMRLRAIAIKGQPLGDLQLNLEDHADVHGMAAIHKFSPPMHDAIEVSRYFSVMFASCSASADVMCGYSACLSRRYSALHLACCASLPHISSLHQVRFAGAARGQQQVGGRDAARRQLGRHHEPA